jgi:hypothetical protein
VTNPERQHRRPSRVGGPVSVTVLVGVIATGLAVGGLTWARSGQGSTAVAPRSAVSTRDPRPVTTLLAVPARRTGAVLPERPTSSRLPNGTVVPIRPADTAGNGSLTVPDDIRTAGWWRGGARLGDPFGATLLAAHVDSFKQGLGPYASLLSVRAGQQIVVASAHLTQTFSVVSLRVVPRLSLPQHGSLFSASGERRLVLVTCAGPYDAERGGYQNLAVIRAVATSGTQPRSGP